MGFTALIENLWKKNFSVQNHGLSFLIDTAVYRMPDIWVHTGSRTYRKEQLTVYCEPARFILDSTMSNVKVAIGWKRN